MPPLPTVPATDSDVRKTFSEFGRVRSININPKTLIGFVQFDDDSQATLAMEKMHDQEFMSHHLFVDYAARDRDQPPPRRDRDGCVSQQQLQPTARHGCTPLSLC